MTNFRVQNHLNKQVPSKQFESVIVEMQERISRMEELIKKYEESKK